MKKLVLQKMCFCDALKLRREIKEERQIPALPTICNNISLKTKLCRKINFYFIIWKAYCIFNYGKPLFDRITNKNGSQEAGTVT